jgi:hypothetical protein
VRLSPAYNDLILTWSVGIFTPQQKGNSLRTRSERSAP